MRRHVARLAAVLLATAGTASAEESSEQIDISSDRDDYVVLEDGDGHYVAVVTSELGKDVFFGDRKRLFAQRVLSGSRNPARGQYSYRVWAPRQTYHADIIAKGEEGWHVRCGDRVTALAESSAATRDEILGKARFLPQPWQRSAYLLARDEAGRYYYIDSLVERRYGFRLFVGKPGNMRELPLRDIVSDSEGDLLFSRKGRLRIDGNRFATDRKAMWLRGKKRRELMILDLELRQNRVLVYDQLGVYTGETLGTPCDEL